MKAKQRVLDLLEALQWAVLELRGSLPPELWDELRQSTLRVLNRLDEARDEEDWLRAERRIDMLLSRFDIRAHLREHLEAMAGLAESSGSTLLPRIERGTENVAGASPGTSCSDGTAGRMRRIWRGLRTLLSHEEDCSTQRIYPEVWAPSHVRVGSTFNLYVVVNSQPTRADAHSMVVRRSPGAAIRIDVTLLLPLGGAIESMSFPSGSVIVSETVDSATLSFALRALIRGQHTIRVVLTHDGVQVHALTHHVIFGYEDQVVDEARPAARSTGIPITVSAAPDSPRLLLQVDGDVRQPGALRVTLRGSRHFLSAPLEGTTNGNVIDCILETCRQMMRVCEVESAARERRLTNLGAALADALLPHAIRSFLSDTSVPEGVALHVESELAWLPWELLHLARATDERYVGEHFAVTRWLRQGGIWDILPGGRTVVVTASTDEAPIDSREETLALQMVSDGRSEELSRLTEVMGVLGHTAEQVGFLHFACHGGAQKHDPLGGYLALSGGLLRPIDVAMPHGVPPSGTLTGACVFLNACSTALPEPSVGGERGWAEAFLRAGAGAFVAPLWPVSEISAQKFAGRFYRDLAAGVTLGEAARRARLGIRHEELPDWLAYAVYAAPWARLHQTTTNSVEDLNG